MNTDTKKYQPCDCIEKCGKFWVQRCDCGNSTNLAEAESWCGAANKADELAAMREAIKGTLHSQASLCEAIKIMLNSGYDGPLPDYARAEAVSALSSAAAAITKLQPFIK